MATTRGFGYGVYVFDVSDETHKFRNAEKMKVDFNGWKDIVVDLDAPHETWGGDKNGKIDYPISKLTIEISTPGKAVEGNLYFDAVSVDSEKSVEETLGSQIAVVSPGYCSDVQGDTPVTLAAPGFKSLTAKCWKQGGQFGSDSTVATVALDAKGNGKFVFPADAYPHGPITVTISGRNGALKDNCYLQLYNKGGVSWNEGMPKDPPPAAKGMSLVFADDFKGPALDRRHNPDDLLRPQAAARLAGLQRACLHQPRLVEQPVLPGRYLSADQGQRQDPYFGPDLLHEERRFRHHRQGPLLLRMPVHRSQRHRHVAGLLAADGLHDGPGQGHQVAVRRVGHHRGLRRRGPRHARTPSISI